MCKKYFFCILATMKTTKQAFQDLSDACKEVAHSINEINPLLKLLSRKQIKQERPFEKFRK